MAIIIDDFDSPAGADATWRAHFSPSRVGEAITRVTRCYLPSAGGHPRSTGTAGWWRPPPGTTTIRPREPTCTIVTHVSVDPRNRSAVTCHLNAAVPARTRRERRTEPSFADTRHPADAVSPADRTGPAAARRCTVHPLPPLRRPPAPRPTAPAGFSGSARGYYRANGFGTRVQIELSSWGDPLFSARPFNPAYPTLMPGAPVAYNNDYYTSWSPTDAGGMPCCAATTRTLPADHVPRDRLEAEEP